MRTRAILGSILASASVLIVGYQAGTSVVTNTGTTLSLPASSTTSGGSAGGTDASAPSSDASSRTTSGTSAASGPADGTYTGSSIRTRFGNVQVAVTIASGSITEVTALQLTDADGRSVQISNRAAPILRSEVLASQSTQVSNVSGATYTTQAYLTSVQSALDLAGA